MCSISEQILGNRRAHRLDPRAGSENKIKYLTVQVPKVTADIQQKFRDDLVIINSKMLFHPDHQLSKQHKSHCEFVGALPLPAQSTHAGPESPTCTCTILPESQDLAISWTKITKISRTCDPRPCSLPHTF